MKTLQIKNKIRNRLKNGVIINGKHYTMAADYLEQNTNYIMEELQLIYKLSNVKNVSFWEVNENIDNEFNYIDYTLKITLDFGGFLENTHNAFILFQTKNN